MRLYILYVCVNLALTYGQQPSVCSSEICRTGDADVHIKDFVCSCKSVDEILDFSAYSLQCMTEVTHLSIEYCNQVIFNKSVFADLKKLDNLTMSHIKNFELTVGAFHIVRHIQFNDIQNLTLGTKALMGAADIRTISITNTQVQCIKHYALNYINHLEKFEVVNSSINCVQENGLWFNTNDDGLVIFKNSQVNNVSAHGLNITSSQVTIDNTTIDDTSAAHMSIKATTEVTITNNDYTKEYTMNFTINSKTIKIKNNNFTILPLKIIETYPSQSSIYLEHNRYETMDFTDLDINTINTMNIIHTNNTFVCDCESDFGIYNTMKDTNEKVKRFYDNNICESPCNATLRDFYTILKRETGCKFEDICNSNETQTSSFTPVPSIETEKIPLDTSTLPAETITPTTRIGKTIKLNDNDQPSNSTSSHLQYNVFLLSMAFILL